MPITDYLFAAALTKKTAPVSVSPEEEQEDLLLTALAVARLKTFKPEEAVSHEEMLEKFGN